MSHFGTSKAIFLRELTHLVPRVDGYRRGCLWPGYGTNAGRWHRVTVTEYVAHPRFGTWGLMPLIDTLSVPVLFTCSVIIASPTLTRPSFFSALITTG